MNGQQQNCKHEGKNATSDFYLYLFCHFIIVFSLLLSAIRFGYFFFASSFSLFSIGDSSSDLFIIIFVFCWLVRCGRNSVLSIIQKGYIF